MKLELEQGRKKLMILNWENFRDSHWELRRNNLQESWRKVFHARGRHLGFMRRQFVSTELLNPFSQSLVQDYRPLTILHHLFSIITAPITENKENFSSFKVHSSLVPILSTKSPHIFSSIFTLFAAVLLCIIAFFSLQNFSFFYFVPATRT